MKQAKITILQKMRKAAKSKENFFERTKNFTSLQEIEKFYNVKVIFSRKKTASDTDILFFFLENIKFYNYFNEYRK